MKIYTKTGDEGKTSLFGGSRRLKCDLRIESYGNVDELNSFLGVLIACIADDEELKELLLEIQRRLFTVGSNLASAPGSSLSVPDLKEEDIVKLENAIDNYNEQLPDLKTFILPGGNVAAGHAHVCRVVARRAERRVVELAQLEEVPAVIIKYLNRLSDYFFVLARKLIIDQDDQEIPWIPR